MKIHQLQREIWLPRPRAEVFPFFADAGNLDALTPPWLHFRILTPPPILMQAGTRIEYRLRIHGLPVRWTTIIRAWEPPRRFVDEQARGPYRQWIHTHTFEERDGGTLCRDEVLYAHWGGALAHRWLVAPDLEKIFAYRQAKLLELFPRR